MAFELIRDQIKINHLIEEVETQAIFDNDIIVPDSKPDIGEVLCSDGEIIVQSCEVRQDKVFIGGYIIYKTLYLPDDRSRGVCSIINSCDFSQIVEVPGVRLGIKTKVKCEIEYIDFNVVNSRKINLKAIVKILSKIFEELTEDMVSGINSDSDVQLLKGNMDINCFIGSHEDVCLITQTICISEDKPEIGEILRTDIKIISNESKYSDGTILVEGRLNFVAMYMGDQDREKIIVTENDIEFSKEIEIDGMSENSTFDIDLMIIDGKYSISEDSDGERREICVEVTVKISSEAYEKKTIEIIEDAYSPIADINIEKKMVKVKDVFSDYAGSFNMRESFNIDGDVPESREIFNVNPKAIITDYKIFDDKIELDGVCTYNVLYISQSEDKPVCYFKGESQFHQVFEVKGIVDSMMCEIDVEMANLTFYQRSPRSIDINTNVFIKIKFLNEISFSIIVKMAEKEMMLVKDIKRPTIVIYFVQPDDTLWGIAKKYGVTVQRILSRNKEIEDKGEIIYPGQQIMIPQRGVG